MTLLSKILHRPLDWALHGMALMPWWLLYVHSTIIYFVVYRLIGYRKRVVRANLAECFPNKSDGERRTIERDFYRHFADYFVETIKLLHVSDEEMRRRMVFTNAHVIDDALNNNQSIVIYAAHYANWEWLTSVTMWLNHDNSDGHDILGQVYQPLQNEWFDAFFLKLRRRFHSTCYGKKAIFREMLKREKDGTHLAIGFISDQHPWVNDEHHVLDFLNHPTAFISGPEAIARRLKCRVAFFDIRKVKRGHYECTLVPMSDNAAQEPPGTLTTRYARLLEQRITEQPAHWLWTHKRWKRPVTFPEGYSRDNELEFYTNH